MAYITTLSTMVSSPTNCVELFITTFAIRHFRIAYPVLSPAVLH